MPITNSLVTWMTRETAFTVDAHGALLALTRRREGRNYLAPGQPTPLLQVRVAGKLYPPSSAEWAPRTRRLTLGFPEAGVSATLTVQAKPTHLTLELTELTPKESVELIVWGPYPTTIGETIGEVIGVVRDTQWAIGIQALNVKTLGGFPGQESDIEPDYTADDTGVYPDLPDVLKKEQLFRGDTARKTPFGSVIQCYCRNRSKSRIIANWGFPKYPAPAFDDGGVIGSKIALFACPAPKALDTIGQIEVAEGLPHPMLDGVWAKKSPRATDSYLIVDFSESTIDRAIEMTQRAGLRYLYHSSPFETWGHFRLKPVLFPHGVAGLRECVERARKAGVRVGFHTLSNFLTPNDPYVTPRPDHRLARSGVSALSADISPTQTELLLDSPEPFLKKTTMNTVVIGDELIRYESVSAAPPWRLMGCQRGSGGTMAAPHARHSTVGKLMDHDYKVFLTDAALTQEVARNIATLCNQTGTLQISLDGLEGNWSTGMGQYGRTLFAQTWYASLAPELRGQINDASNPGHFNWHAYTRMNWGEPWYAGFRESQTLYRFKNQLHYSRNLMPRMLGWFALGPETTLEDAEWLLARAAGFDAGFALATSLASTAPSILEAIRQWETARRTRAFPEKLKADLRDNQREFHLEPVGASQWDLYPVKAGQRGTPRRVRGKKTL